LRRGLSSFGYIADEKVLSRLLPENICGKNQFGKIIKIY